MSTQNRRSAFPSSLAKRQALSSSSSSSSASGNVGKVVAAEPHLAKKRAPLSNLTNRNSVSNNGLRSSGGSSCTLVSENWFCICRVWFKRKCWKDQKVRIFASICLISMPTLSFSCVTFVGFFDFWVIQIWCGKIYVSLFTDFLIFSEKKCWKMQENDIKVSFSVIRN